MVVQFRLADVGFSFRNSKMGPRNSRFTLILLMSCFVGELMSLTSSKVNSENESRKGLSPSFEEEWDTLENYDDDLQEGNEIDPFPDLPDLPELNRIEIPVPSNNDELKNDFQPVVSQPLPNKDPAFQSIEDIEALGIDEEKMDSLSITQPVTLNPIFYENTARPTPSRFLSTNICGEQFLCRAGSRGPCRPNEILTHSNATTPRSISCLGIVSSPWNGCFPASRIGSAIALSTTPIGECILRYPTRPCFGYPPGYRYSESTKRCYPSSSLNMGLSVSGPCDPNKAFVDIDGVYGMCRCRDPNSLLYMKDNRCYQIYSKGPCAAGHWLEPSVNGYGICKRSPCPTSKCDGQHIYWKATPQSRGGCYKTFTRGPCQHGSYFMIEDFPTKKGRCVSRYRMSSDPKVNLQWEE